MDISANFDFDNVKSDVQARLAEVISTNNISPLVSHCKPLIEEASHSVDVDIRSVVDICFKEHVGKGLSTFEELEHVVKLTIDAASNQISTKILPVTLLGDIFDSKTLEDCEKLFSIVENHISVWKSVEFFKNIKNQLLRICNDLLRRLSKSQNTVFCGRILVFLARFFPLFERSGLNLIGEFNRDNMISIDTQDESVASETVVKTEDKEEGEADEPTALDSAQVDYNLYVKFWQLQEFFRCPNQCYDKNLWNKFYTNTTQVLAAFNNMKLDTSSSLQTVKSSDTVYFAKFLTNQKLLELQLSDSNFRRYILIQFLIVLQYLNSSVKFKSDSYVLTDEQKQLVNELTVKVLDLISHTPPDGPQMKSIIMHIMEREENWSEWKNDGCIDIKPSDTEIKPQQLKRKRRVGQEVLAAERAGRFSLGNRQLTQLWNQCPDNWEACRSKKRVFTPNVEEFFDDILHASPSTRTNTIIADGHFTWRALRLLSQKSHHYFTPSNQVVKPLTGYFESIFEKLSHDMQIDAKNTPKEENIDDTEDISDDELLRDKAPDESEKSKTPRGLDDEPMDVNEASLVKTVIEKLAPRIGNRWKQLASTLKFGADEIEYFESDSKDDAAAALKMLFIWTEQDDPEKVTVVNLQKAIDRSNIDIRL